MHMQPGTIYQHTVDVNAGLEPDFMHLQSANIRGKAFTQQRWLMLRFCLFGQVRTRTKWHRDA